MTDGALVTFLGLAERATYVRDGNTNLFKWNVLGLKTTIISYIYPLRIPGYAAGFAIDHRTIGKDIKLRLVNSVGLEIGTMNIQFSQPVLENEPPALKKDGPVLLVQEHGTSVTFLPLGDTGWVVNEPGIYFLEQTDGLESARVGMLHFAVIDPRPLTEERVKAIRSDPGAIKAIRMEFGCKFCPSKLKTYAAIERSEKFEREALVWYQLLEDRFTCTCGRTSMPLQLIRRNLHGLLGHLGKHSDDPNLIPLYEESSLNSVRVNLYRLLTNSCSEETLQQFIDENPILLHQFPAERIIAKPKILTTYVADFAIVTPQKELVLIEIEKCDTRLMKKDGDIAAALSHAFDQVRNWLHTVDEHRLAVLDSLDIDRESVSTIRGVVIAGRDSGYDALALRKLKGGNYGRISFLTYDDILLALDSLIRRLRG
jgi:hypothetical protein